MRTHLALAAGLVVLSVTACSAAPTSTTADEGTQPVSEDSDPAPAAAATPAAATTDPAATTATAPAVPPLPDGTMPIPAVPGLPGVPVIPGAPVVPGAGAVACPNGGVGEIEGNETPETATDLGAAVSLCGSLSSAADVDHFSFIMPADAKGFGFSGQFGGAGANLTITAGGVTTSMSDQWPWFPGTRYVITVSGGVMPSYALTLNIPR